MKKLLIILFIIFLIVFAFFIKLKYFGVSIDNFRFNSYYIEKFYLKLDDKLVIKADNIHIPHLVKQNNTKSYDLTNTIENILKAITYFKIIEIKDIVLGEERFSISYQNNIFYFDNTQMNITASTYFDNKILNIDLQSLLLKKLEILTTGKLKIDLSNKHLNYYGDFIYEETSGEIKINSNMSKLDFFVTSNKLKNITFIRNFVALHSTIEKWMYDSVFGDYQLEYLKGSIDLDKSQVILSSLEGKATVTNAKIKFHENLDFVNTNNIDVIFANDTLSFNLSKPTYKGIDIDGSFVEITDLSGHEPSLLLNITTNHLLGKDILDILKAYKINIPLIQKSGNTQASVVLRVDLNTSDVSASGEFDITNAHILLNNIDFLARKGNVKLVDNIIKIDNFDILVDDFLNFTGDMIINTKTHMINGDINIVDLLISYGNNQIISITNKPTIFKYDIKNSTLTLPELNFVLQQKKDQTYTLTFNDIKNISPYIKMVDLSNIYHGILIIEYKNQNNMDFHTQFTLNDSILSKNNLPVKQFIFNGKFLDGNLDMTNFDNSIAIAYHTSIVDVKLQNYDIIYNSLENKNQSNNLSIKINGLNSNVKYNNLNILSDAFTLNKDIDKIDFKSKFKNSTLNINILNDKTQIYGNNLNDLFVNTVLDKDILKGGSVNLNLESSHSNSSILHGNIELFDTNIENIGFINSVLTFVETSPAIINPLLAIPSAYRAITDGLGHKNYMVKHGMINLTYDTQNEHLNAYESYLQGSRSDLVGNIFIDKKQQTIDGNISVVILKDYTSVVKHIPVVGYILLGDDKSVTISTKVSGNLDDPKVETFATSDAIKGTGNILKRIITSPFKLFEGNSKE